MTPDLIAVALAAFVALIGGAWVLLMLAGRQWEKRQETQFATLNKNISDVQVQMGIHYADMARLELKLSESEKNTMREFALKRDVESLHRTFDARADSILTEVRDISKRMDDWLKTISGYMDRQADKKQHHNNQ